MGGFKWQAGGDCDPVPCILEESIQLDDFIAKYPEQIRGDTIVYLDEWVPMEFTTALGTKNKVERVEEDVVFPKLYPSQSNVDQDSLNSVSLFENAGIDKEYVYLRLKGSFSQEDYDAALAEFRNRVGNKNVCVVRFSVDVCDNSDDLALKESCAYNKKCALQKMRGVLPFPEAEFNVTFDTPLFLDPVSLPHWGGAAPRPITTAPSAVLGPSRANGTIGINTRKSLLTKPILFNSGHVAAYIDELSYEQLIEVNEEFPFRVKIYNSAFANNYPFYYPYFYPDQIVEGTVVCDFILKIRHWFSKTHLRANVVSSEIFSNSHNARVACNFSDWQIDPRFANPEIHMSMSGVTFKQPNRYKIQNIKRHKNLNYYWWNDESGVSLETSEDVETCDYDSAFDNQPTDNPVSLRIEGHNGYNPQFGDVGVFASDSAPSIDSYNFNIFDDEGNLYDLNLNQSIAYHPRISPYIAKNHTFTISKSSNADLYGFTLSSYYLDNDNKFRLLQCGE